MSTARRDYPVSRVRSGRTIPNLLQNNITPRPSSASGTPFLRGAAEQAGFRFSFVAMGNGESASSETNEEEHVVWQTMQKPEMDTAEENDR